MTYGSMHRYTQQLMFNIQYYIDTYMFPGYSAYVKELFKMMISKAYIWANMKRRFLADYTRNSIFSKSYEVKGSNVKFEGRNYQ